ncbi:MAG: DNA methyltransferase [bacterium]
MESEVIINKPKMIELLSEMSSTQDLPTLRKQLFQLREDISSTTDDVDGVLNIDTNGEAFSISQKYLVKEIQQIEKTQTIERAKYYLSRLVKAISETKTSKINEINLNRWKEYDNILTDSLWILQKRDTSGPHSSWYWGNFIPQIPHQLMLRYTKKDDWVIDPFAGSGTTLLECQRLGRNGLGVELQPEIALKATGLLKMGWRSATEDLFSESFPTNHSAEKVKTIIEVGDSTEVDFVKLLRTHGAKSAQLLILHPPYYDIIKFSKDPKDLSNAGSTEAFIEMFGKVVSNTFPVLEKGRYLAVVIGDKYSKGEWIPLGFMLMNEVLKHGYILKGIIVKNFEETLAKRNQKELWRYRALVGGFYIFKHEYILLFKKVSR